MIEDLGASGRRVVGYARQIAADLGSPTIGTEHLFLAVGKLEDVAIHRQLAELGVNLEEVCAEVRSAAEPEAGGRDGELPLTAAAEAAIAAAKEEAAGAAQEKVEAPHILIGVLRDESGLTAKTLEQDGADLDALAKTLREMLDEGNWSADFYEQSKPIEQPGISTTESVLESLGRDLTEAAEKGELNPIIGREREIFEIVQILSGKKKNNAIIVGPAGVGKTAVVEGLAQRIVAGKVPKKLQEMRIRTVEVGSLVAGTIYRGQFEERLKGLIDEVRDRKDVILFIDEIHMLVGAGEVGQGSMDAANMLKPVLTEGTLKVIGATTTDEYRRHFEKDEALARRFQKVLADEPSREDAVTILAGLRGRYEDFHEVAILDESLYAAVDLSIRYMHDRSLPDKALDLLDRACTQTTLRLSMGEWMPELAPSQAEEAAVSADGRPVVGPDDVAEVLSILLEIPIARLTVDERERLVGMADALKKKVIGQDHAVDAIAETMIRSRTGFGSPTRPIGNFMFLGPTGVGKTKLAQELAAFLFGDKDEIVQVNMSEYMEAHSVSGLIGSPPGYVGHEEGGKLTNAVQAKPYAIVLLDEIEKAHPQVWQLFLPMLEEGRLTDSLGRVVDFRNTVVIMTSNVGARRIQEAGRAPTGFGLGEAGELSFEEMTREVDKEVRRVFEPEFLNRLDELIVFRPIAKDSLRVIVGNLLREMVPVELALTDEALEFLVERSYEPTMGARPARRAIQRLVGNPLSLMVARGEIAERDTVEVGFADGALSFAKSRKEEPVGVGS